MGGIGCGRRIASIICGGRTDRLMETMQSVHSVESLLSQIKKGSSWLEAHTPML
jgi:hypothetical protein